MILQFFESSLFGVLSLRSQEKQNKISVQISDIFESHLWIFVSNTSIFHIYGLDEKKPSQEHKQQPMENLQNQTEDGWQREPMAGSIGSRNFLFDSKRKPQVMRLYLNLPVLLLPIDSISNYLGISSQYNCSIQPMSFLRAPQYGSTLGVYSGIQGFCIFRDMDSCIRRNDTESKNFTRNDKLLLTCVIYPILESVVVAALIFGKSDRFEAISLA